MKFYTTTSPFRTDILSSALSFNKEDAWLSIGDIGTWENGIILYNMPERA